MAIEVDISRKFSSFDLNIKFEANNGMVLLFGRSGSGKTLTLQSIAGLHRPDKGFIRIEDTVFFDSSKGLDIRPQDRNIGYMSQDYSLFPHLSVEENIGYGLTGSTKSRKIKEMLELFQLKGMEKRRTTQLSGGQKQKVALARALVRQPRLLLLDEPLAALDGVARPRLRDELRSIQQKFNISVIFITHDPLEAFTMADTLVVLNNGRVEQVGSPEQVFNRPINLSVAELVGIKNIYKGVISEVDDGTVSIGTGGSAFIADHNGFSKGDEVMWCIRPEHVMILREDKPEGYHVKENKLDVEITRVQNTGPVYQMELVAMSGMPIEIAMPVHSFKRLGLDVGRHVTVSLKKKEIHVFRPGIEE